MPDINSIVISTLAAVCIHYLYLQYLEVTRDVNELYLNEQSVVEAVREEGETAIHKSNKLDNAQAGLRVGLDIRYDFYKIRSGNLSDVWEVLVGTVKKKDPKRVLSIDGESLEYLVINCAAQKLGTFFQEQGITLIKIPLEMVSFLSFDVLIVLLSGFINQITVEIYDTLENSTDCDSAVIVSTDNDGPGYFNIETQQIYNKSDSLDSYTNVYTYHKDRGIALSIARNCSVKVSAKVNFTQLNLVSAIASTMKHWPSGQEWTDRDTLLIVQGTNPSNENLLNTIVKLLTSFVSGTHAVIARENNLRALVEDASPTILSMSAQSWELVAPEVSLSLPEKAIFSICSRMLRRGKLPSFRFFSSRIRLIYINKSLTGTKPSVSQDRLNFWRCYLSARIVLEAGYYNIVGPVILTDIFDYRNIAVPGLQSFGCIAQSLEIKLAKLKDKKGELMVRGYTIGKTTAKMDDKEGERDTKKTDGFMPLLNVYGRFGNDGCVYIL